jgi:hypothetical protein
MENAPSCRTSLKDPVCHPFLSILAMEGSRSSSSSASSGSSATSLLSATVILTRSEGKWGSSLNFPEHAEYVQDLHIECLVIVIGEDITLQWYSVKRRGSGRLRRGMLRCSETWYRRLHVGYSKHGFIPESMSAIVYLVRHQLQRHLQFTLSRRGVVERRLSVVTWSFERMARRYTHKQEE